MKLTLDQLKVDSYSTQICENELTEVKGGSWFFCSCAAAKEAIYQGNIDSGGSGGSGGAGSYYGGEAGNDCMNY